MKLASTTVEPIVECGLQRIAHATDLTRVSERAFAWAATLARANRAELLLLHVVPPPTPIFEVESPLKTTAELAMSVLLTKLKLTGVNARGFMLSGTKSIDHQILQAARLEDIDLIVVGTESRKGISRLLVGSVASRVIARAHCPILVVPAISASAGSSSPPTPYLHPR
jgi:nucleotide-binding universal stress UspA family protein